MYCSNLHRKHHTFSMVSLKPSSVCLRLEEEHLPSSVMLYVGICHSIPTTFYKEILSPIPFCPFYPLLLVVNQLEVENLLCKACVGCLTPYFRTQEKLSPTVFYSVVLVHQKLRLTSHLNILLHKGLVLG